MRSWLRILIILFFPVFLLWHCGRKTSQVVEEVVPPSPDSALFEEVVDSTLEERVVYLGDTLISYSRSGCYGKCPVFNFVVLDSAYLSYNGTRYVSKIGTYEAYLDSASWTSLSEILDSFLPHQYSGKYPDDEKMWIVDLPVTTTVYKAGDDRSVIVNNHSAPDRWIDFEKKLEAWVKEVQLRPASAN